MPSAKGKPTDPKLREKVVEEVKQQTNKDGSGKGQMAAWKAAKIGKEYEAQGGEYENVPGSKDKPVKGPPQKKSASEKKAEMNTSKKRASEEGVDDEEEEEDEEPEEPKAKKKTISDDKGEDEEEAAKEEASPKKTAKGKGGRPKGGKNAVSKSKKEPRVGERKSSRVRQAAKDEGGAEEKDGGEKRKNVDGESEGAKKKTKK